MTELPQIYDGGADSFDASVPEHLRDGLRRYVEQRIRPGGFLQSVLENDLIGAVARADWTFSLSELRLLCQWIWTYTPSACHGSGIAFQSWLNLKSQAETSKPAEKR